MKKARNASKSAYTTISIPTALFEKTRERLKGTGFTSVSSYVTFVLRELLSSNSQNSPKNEGGRSPGSREAFDSEDDARVKSKLRGLGYKI